MKILCVIDSLGSGGAQRQMVELAKGLKEKGHEVVFIIYHDINFFRSDLVEVDIPIKLIMEPNYFKRILKIRKAIRRSKPNAVLSFLETPNFISTLAGFPFRKWKLVVGERSASPNISKSFKSQFYRGFHLFANYVVSNSLENLKIVKKVNPFLKEKECKVIYNIVDFDIWKPTVDYKIKNDGKLNLLVAASHHYLKNAKGLIEGVQRLSLKEKDQLKIDWYGKVGLDDSFKEAVELVNKYSLNRIFKFHKATKEINNKMKYADVVGLFSFYEGLPNALCEGIVLGKPIISSAVSDIPLLINNDNLLFNPNDINEISTALAYLISLQKVDLYRIGKENRNLNKELFNKETIVSKYLNLLK